MAKEKRIYALGKATGSVRRLPRTAFIGTYRLVHATEEIRYLLRLNQRSNRTTPTIGTATTSATRLILACLASSLL